MRFFTAIGVVSTPPDIDSRFGQMLFIALRRVLSEGKNDANPKRARWT